MNDWRIVVYLRDPRIPAELTAGGDTLELLPELCDEADAVEALEDWAATFQRYGKIPRSMDFQSESPIAVIRRTGRRRFLCRARLFRVRDPDRHVERLLPARRRGTPAAAAMNREA